MGEAVGLKPICRRSTPALNHQVPLNITYRDPTPGKEGRVWPSVDLPIQWSPTSVPGSIYFVAGTWFGPHAADNIHDKYAMSPGRLGGHAISCRPVNHFLKMLSILRWFVVHFSSENKPLGLERKHSDRAFALYTANPRRTPVQFPASHIVPYLPTLPEVSWVWS